jgi:hypothetical protein
MVLVLLGAAPASAQFVYGPGFGGGFSYRGHHGAMRGSFGFSTYYRGFFAGPIVTYSFGPPIVAFGAGPGFGNPFFLPPPIFDTNVVPVANNLPGPPPPAPIRNPNNAAPAITRSGGFLIITPRSADARAEAPGTISPKVDRVASPPAKPPVLRFDPLAAEKAIGKTEIADVDPAAEAARQIKLAREAFALGEYGEAIERFDRAIKTNASGVEVLFLRAQAQFAAGDYAAAVASIQIGLKVNPEWPAARFLPAEMSGRARFDMQLAELKNAFAAQTNEASLQFLLAYQLWFSGERAEATKLFRKLRDQLKDASVIEPFLK